MTEVRYEAHLQTAARSLTVALPVLLVLGRGAADTALSLVAILFLVRSAAMRDWSWLAHTWVRVAVVLWLWMLLISGFAFDPVRSYGAALSWVRFLLFAAAAEHWVLDDAWLKRLAWVACAVLAFVASDVIWQFMSGHDVLGHASQGIRLTGPFLHPEAGVFMTRLLFPALLSVWAWFSAGVRRPVRRRLVPMVLGLVFFTAIFLTGERAALILSLFGLLIVIVLWQGVRWAVIATAGITVVMVVLAAANPRIVQRQMDSTYKTLRTFSQTSYGQLWHSGIKLGTARPLFGVGVQNFRVACSDPKIGLPPTVSDRCGLHPHNMYIQWFADTGIPGVIGFMTLVVVWLRRFWKCGAVASWSGWLLGPAIGVFLYLWPIATTGGFFSNWNAATFWLVLGWTLSAARRAERNSPLFLADRAVNAVGSDLRRRPAGGERSAP